MNLYTLLYQKIEKSKLMFRYTRGNLIIYFKYLQRKIKNIIISNYIHHFTVLKMFFLSNKSLVDLF